MTEDRFGIERPLVDEKGKGPVGVSRPLVKTNDEMLIAELESNIESEDDARTEYERTINLLEQNGYPDLADIVRDIQEDEIRHNEEFKTILSQVRRSTSY